MKVLVLGGTGAMGVYLVQLLAQQGHEVIVTSRRQRESGLENLKYIQGDAHDNLFLKDILSQKFDAIVDFMVYHTEEFAARYRMFLDVTEQYIFFSSSRVYADSKSPITESSPRLLDVCKDKEYLATDEYALTKARQEDMLMQSGKQNWTIIRPYITYSNARLQLGVLEKEYWLQRALRGGTIVFGKDIATRRTTLTYGEDVSRVVSMLIGNDKAFGKAVHITGQDTMLWSEVLELYLDVIECKIGKRPNVLMTENSDGIKDVLCNQYQIDCDRLYNRVFDNSFVNDLCGGNASYTPMRDGLTRCVEEFLNSQKVFLWNNPKLEAWMDRQAKERTSVNEFVEWKSKMKYLFFRYL